MRSTMPRQVQAPSSYTPRSATRASVCHGRLKDELVELLKAEGKTWKQMIGTGIDLSNVAISAPNAEVPTGLPPGQRRRLREVRRQRQARTRRSPLQAGPQPDTHQENLQSFLPTRESDATYYDLVEKAHSALGLEFVPRVKRRR